MAPPPWQHRIVGSSEDDPAQILASPQHWRVHPTHHQAAVRGVFREVGIVHTILITRRTHTVIDGHLHVVLALREHQPLVPVPWVDLRAHEARHG